MRRLCLAVLAVLVVAPPAHAGTCSFSASTRRGPAPLAVAWRATCDPTVTVRWRFADGATADGAATTHTFRVGTWRAAADVTAAGGTVAHYDLGTVTSYRLTLQAPRSAAYGDVVTLRARLTPKLAGGIVIAGSRATRLGPASYQIRMRMTRPGPFSASFGRAQSAPVWILLRPRLDIALDGAPAVGSDLRVATTLEPAAAGAVRVRVDGRATTRVDTRRERHARIVVTLVPRKGWIGVRRSLAVHVVQPALAPGARGAAVVALESRLRELHYALRGIDGVYGQDDVEAVLAFEKVNGLDRTGRVDAALWARLAHVGVPRARYRGTHVEVDKTRQVLFFVVDGAVDEVVHTSTGATGNTPVGLWHVYSKVAGWSWVLWYPSYFLRGFAVHGYPEVPAYPASHGCVRVPMWIAPRLYARMPYGFPIYVYY